MKMSVTQYAIFLWIVNFVAWQKQAYRAGGHENGIKNTDKARGETIAVKDIYCILLLHGNAF